MSTADVKHLVAVPFPGRGHVNALLNFCNLLLRSTPPESATIVTFAVTQEWLGILTASTSTPFPHDPQRLRFRTMPNAVPSERNRGADHAGFIHAVLTKMEPHFDHLIDELDPPASAIVADTYNPWAVAVGNRRHIPVFSFFPMPPAIFAFLFHYERLVEKGIVPAPVDLDGEGRLLSREPVPVIELPVDDGRQILAECFPGIGCGIQLPDFNPVVNYKVAMALIRSVVTCWVRRAQGIIFNTVYELDRPIIDALRADPELPFPIYTMGPCIPFDESLLQRPGAAEILTVRCIDGDRIPAASPGDGGSSTSPCDYYSWLDSQPAGSVLYVSLGSFLSTSADQIEEIASGLLEAGYPFLWVLRDESRSPCLQEMLTSAADKMLGMIVPWCDQLRVLCHTSVGAFLTHCGWNSTMEGLFAGKPMLAMPIFWDQPLIGAMIADGWGVGLRLKKAGKELELIGRDGIADAVRSVVGTSPAADGFRKKAADFMGVCRCAVRESHGSSIKNLELFMEKIEREKSPC